MKNIILAIILLASGCNVKKTFNLTSDYREFPIGVDCEKPSDVNLTYQKEGLPTIHIDQNNLEFKIIKNDKNEDRPICIFNELTLLQFCTYKGGDEVAPYWVPAYQKINTVKCKEVLK